MQLMIDTADSSPKLLRIYAQTLIGLADALEHVLPSQASLPLLTPGDAPQPWPTPVPAGTPAPFPVPQVVTPAASSNVIPFALPGATHATAPQPAATATIPASQQPPPPAFDVAGLPWDERIHSSSRATREDGTWRAKRNVDPALVLNVTAELVARRNAGGHAPAAASLPPSPPAPAEPVAAAMPVPLPPLQYPGASPVPVPTAPPYVHPGAAPMGAATVPVPAAPPVGAVPAASDDQLRAGFSPLLAKYSGMAQQRGWGHDMLLKLCKSAGACDASGNGDPNALLMRPQLIRVVDMTLDEVAAGRVAL